VKKRPFYAALTIGLALAFVACSTNQPVLEQSLEAEPGLEDFENEPDQVPSGFNYDASIDDLGDEDEELAESDADYPDTGEDTGDLSANDQSGVTPQAVTPGPNSPLRARVVSIAANELGVKENPMGSNHAKSRATGNYYGWATAQGYPWCAEFVSWVWHRSKTPIFKGEIAAVRGIYEWGKKNRRLRSKSARPRIGDAIIYLGGGVSHTGLVARVYKNGNVDTIEGNYGNRVAKRVNFDPTSAKFHVAGFVSPVPFEKPKPSAPKPISNLELKWPNVGRDRGTQEWIGIGTPVIVVQELLNARGAALYTDGTFDTATEDAVKRFQRSRNLPANGVVTATPWRHLVVGSSIVKQGNKGYAVMALKRLLVEHGYESIISPDSTFSYSTTVALKNFQKKHDLTVDGVTDTRTWNTLLRGVR
jgi:peptidoglycan hydrolase-like protein with peptidoglycan-binding domain